MSANCPLCGSACSGAEFGPLLDPQLRWLWEQIGRAADRRGDPALTEGSLSVKAPSDAEERAAAAGLVGARVLRQGQARSINLEQLTLKLRARGPRLTPGAVAAHAIGRALAVRAAANARRESRESELLAVFSSAVQSVLLDLIGEPNRIWHRLRRSGWVARLVNVGGADRMLRLAVAVIAALPSPGLRSDRRHLAATITADPHALDHGSMLAGLVIAVLTAAERITARQRPRDAWASVGVDCDDVVGGLVALGILPVDWKIPLGATVTLPPRVLKICEWPPADTDESWVFVTENPSVVSAAAELMARGHCIRLLCTNGTPSAIEIAAIAHLSDQGWRIAVRADFDAAGLAHVSTILQAAPHAIPWRMGATDYLQSVAATADGITFDDIPEASWDSNLSVAMREKHIAAYEESLLPLLLDDLRRGVPG